MIEQTHKPIPFNGRMHLILQRRTLPTKEQKMKQGESRESMDLSMDQLNAKSSELYGELPRRNPEHPFERPHRNHLLRRINRIKYEQPLRRKGWSHRKLHLSGSQRNIQHWDCCPTHTMAIILSIEGKFHSASIDGIWAEKEDMPPKQRITLISIEEIIKAIEKVQTLVSMIDDPKGAGENIPRV